MTSGYKDLMNCLKPETMDTINILQEKIRELQEDKEELLTAIKELLDSIHRNEKTIKIRFNLHNLIKKHSK